MSTGGGQKSLNEIMAAMNVPGISKKNIHKDRKSNWNIMGKYFSRGDKAGEEEKQLAEEQGDTVNGYPAITVIVDWGGQKHQNTATMLSRGLALL